MIGEFCSSISSKKNSLVYAGLVNEKKSREKDIVLLVKVKKAIIHSARVPQTTK